LEAHRLDSPAFGELATAEMDVVYRMACHLSRNPDDAADLVQGMYLWALRAEASSELLDAGNLVQDVARTLASR